MAFPFLLAGAAALAGAITKGGPRRQFKWNKKAADYQNEQNRKIQDEQRMYDSPSSQMARYKQAGLNPHLIYGSGSSSSGGTFPISAAPVQAPDSSYPDVASTFIQASQAATQMQLQDAKTNESVMKAQALELQNEISKTNPMLNPSVAAAVSAAMEEVARMKSTEAFLWSAADSTGRSQLSIKIESEVEALTQRLGLNTADLKIKNRILESKEFENAMKQVQAEWLKDAKMSPEHVRQGLMLILSKMMGR